jgi:hypothetical protein
METLEAHDETQPRAREFDSLTRAGDSGCQRATDHLPDNLRTCVGPNRGTASAVGVVTLTATNQGTMPATGNLTVSYGAALASGATAVVTCATATDCTYGTNFTVNASGSAVTVTFVTSVTLNLGNSVSISGVRLNVSSFPSGSGIWVHASGTALLDVPNTVLVASVTGTPQPARP